MLGTRLEARNWGPRNTEEHTAHGTMQQWAEENTGRNTGSRNKWGTQLGEMKHKEMGRTQN